MLLGSLFPNPCTLLLLIIYVESLYKLQSKIFTRQNEIHEIKRKYLNTYVSPEIPTFILPIVVSGFLDPKNGITFRVSSALMPSVPFFNWVEKGLDAFY